MRHHMAGRNVRSFAALPRTQESPPPSGHFSPAAVTRCPSAARTKGAGQTDDPSTANDDGFFARSSMGGQSRASIVNSWSE